MFLSFMGFSLILQIFELVFDFSSSRTEEARNRIFLNNNFFSQLIIFLKIVCEIY